MLLNLNFMDQGWWVTNDRRLHFPVFKYLTSQLQSRKDPQLRKKTHLFPLLFTVLNSTATLTLHT